MNFHKSWFFDSFSAPWQKKKKKLPLQSLRFTCNSFSCNGTSFQKQNLGYKIIHFIAGNKYSEQYTHQWRATRLKKLYLWGIQKLLGNYVKQRACWNFVKRYKSHIRPYHNCGKWLLSGGILKLWPTMNHAIGCNSPVINPNILYSLTLHIFALNTIKYGPSIPSLLSHNHNWV